MQTPPLDELRQLTVPDDNKPKAEDLTFQKKRNVTEDKIKEVNKQDEPGSGDRKQTSGAFSGVGQEV